MSNKTDIYTIVGWLSLLTMPLAAGVSFGWNAYTAMLGNGVLPFFAVVGGGSFAVGLELFGIAAGHLAIKAFQKQQWVYLVTTAAAILAYVIVGTYEMRSIAFARFVPILAVAVYIIVGIESVMKETDEATAIQSAVDADADRREREAAAQRQHELDMKRVDAQLEAKKSADAAAAQAKAEIARVNAEARKFRAETNRVSPMFPGSFQVSQETKKETMEKHWKPGIGPTELAQLAGVTKGYASKFISGRVAPTHQAAYTNGVATKQSLVTGESQ